VTVTASGGGTTHTTTVALTVNAATAPDFTVTASPSGLSVTHALPAALRFQHRSVMALVLRCRSPRGLPTGVTASFSPSPIAAPGSGSSRSHLLFSNTAITGTQM